MAKKTKDNSDKVKLFAAIGLFVVAGGIYFAMNSGGGDRPTGTVTQVFGGGTDAPPAKPADTMTSSEEDPEMAEEDPMLENPPAGSHMANPEFVFPEDPEAPPEPPPDR